MKRGIVALVASAALAGLVACGSKAPLPANIGAAASAAPTPLPTSAIEPRKDKTPPGVEAHALFPVPDGSIGPFLARRGDVVLGVYVGVSSEGTRRVVSVPLAADGEARGEAKVIAPVATDATMLAVRATGGPKPGFVAAWTALGGDRGEILDVVGVSDDGRPRGAPSELARTTDDIVWIDVVSTTRGAIVLWAEQTKDGDANLLAAALAPDGALRGLPARVARGVRSWQAVPTPDGVGLALASTLSAAKTALVWERVDADAHAKASVTLAPGARLAGDVDAVRVGDETIVAWTDATQPDPAPTLAAVDDAGHVRGPKRAIEGGAGGTLVGLASGPAGAVMAWEEPFRRGRASKRVLLGKVDAKGLTVDTHAVAPLDLQGSGAPELAALSSGFALLAPTIACAADASCEGAPVLPTFVRFDANLGVVQVVPFRLGVLRQQAGAGWSLSCATDATDDCVALAAAPDETGATRVSAVSLRSRPNAFRAPIAPAPPPDAPVVLALDTVAAGQPYTDLATAHAGAGTVSALLAVANDETSKRDDVAVIELHAFDERGVAAATAVATRRALAAGGVAIATTDRDTDGAAIAWVGRDAGDPQVHVTRLDPRGKILRDVQLTTAKGDASDVAIAWAGDQWIVAWVDGRDGNGEVYATTLDRDGRTIGRGQRITNAPGDASDVALLATGGNVWLAWADPRESPQDGFADIYAAQLRPKDAARVGDEARVLATAAHSRSPSLGARGKDVAVAWIEEAPTGADPKTARAYGAMFAWLGPGGQPASEPRRLPTVGGGFPTAVALDGPGGGVLHVVLARADEDLLSLDGIDMTRDPGSPYPLVTLDGPPSLDVAIGLDSSWLFWTDESADATARRVRRATVRWTR